MGNPIPLRMKLGTIGELLVQLRLLQYDIQAAPPIKDSGNDLIAVRGAIVRLIQVKTTKSERYPAPNKSKRYHILAAVQLIGEDRDVRLDYCKIYLLTKDEVKSAPRKFNSLPDEFRLTAERIKALFS